MRVVEEFSNRPNEDVKLAAACLLGSIAAKNPGKYLNAILDSLLSDQILQGLNSLHEYLSISSSQSEDVDVALLWSKLAKVCETEISPAVERIVSECLALITSMNDQILPMVKESLQSPLKSLRICSLNAIRHVIAANAIPGSETVALGFQSISLSNDEDKVITLFLFNKTNG